jgi:hypothetical protein
MPGRLDADLNDAGVVRIVAKPLHDGRFRFGGFQLGPDNRFGTASLASTAPHSLPYFSACNLSRTRLTKPFGTAHIRLGPPPANSLLLAGMLETTAAVHSETKQTERVRTRVTPHAR